MTRPIFSQNLLNRFSSGDKKAFSEIYDLYWDKLYYAAYKKLNEQEAAEEVVQDLFVVLWRKRFVLKINNLDKYLAVMLRYGIYKYMSRQKQMRDHETAFLTKQGSVFDEIDKIENKFILDKIWELSYKLPERCRLVFQYNKLQDLSIDSVAEKMNISPKTAEIHLTKALKLIRLSLRSMFSFL